MALYSDIPSLIPLLQAIPGVQQVTEGWPEDFANLPCIAMEEANNAPDKQADDTEYLTLLEYYLHLFGYDSALLRQIASKADDVMLKRGYQRTLACDLNNEDARHKVLRYKKLFGRIDF